MLQREIWYDRRSVNSPTFRTFCSFPCFCWPILLWQEMPCFMAKTYENQIMRTLYIYVYHYTYIYIHRYMYIYILYTIRWKHAESPNIGQLGVSECRFLHSWWLPNGDQTWQCKVPNFGGISQLAMFEDTGEYSLILSLEYPMNIPRPHYTPVLVKPKFLI